jgi:hypothetical protein
VVLCYKVGWRIDQGDNGPTFLLGLLVMCSGILIKKVHIHQSSSVSSKICSSSTAKRHLPLRGPLLVALVAQISALLNRCSFPKIYSMGNNVSGFFVAGLIFSQSQWLCQRNERNILLREKQLTFSDYINFS